MISRRNLLSTSLFVPSIFLAGTAKASDLPTKWDHNYDVIVIGSGGAGLSAGIVAKEAGANTVVLEKLPIVGGNTLISGGGLNAAVPEDSKKKGVEDSPELHAKQTLAAGDNRADPELVKTLTQNAPESVAWLKKIGVKFNPDIYQIYGGLWPRAHNPVGQSGGDYIKACQNYAKKIDLPILTNHKVVGIIRETPNSGRVLGVKVQVGKKVEYWKANKGVVAAAGGFAANGKMCALFDPRLEKLNTTNNVGSTGEVLGYIQDVNGLATGMDYIQCVPLVAPGYKSSGNLIQAIGYTMFVNKNGRRFVAEDERRDVIRDATLAQPGQVIYPITDSEGFAENCRYYGDMNNNALKEGTLFKADTIEELAKKIGVPPEALKKSVEEFNSYVDTKKDPLGRQERMLQFKIDKAPFYAGPIGQCRHHTMGGARIDTKARVLDRQTKVIPGLYAAGEVTGGIHGSNRVGGNAIADAFTFGRIAGKSAAQGI